ncbi:MAG TPA: hypothetical protein VJ066_03860 [Candidatus Bathyarchaeia archaeon]|nr:hypothetical protein [Candidatus Bathyarchaeia archaeon]
MALAETPANYAVNHDCIREIKLKLKDINTGQETYLQEFQIEIASNTGNYAFRMDKKDYLRVFP